MRDMGDDDGAVRRRLVTLLPSASRAAAVAHSGVARSGVAHSGVAHSGGALRPPPRAPEPVPAPPARPRRPHATATPPPDPTGELAPARLSAGAFDPGRHGVRALILLGVVVLAIAAVLAWRARPDTDPLPETPEPAIAAAPPDPAATAAPTPTPTAAPDVVVVAVAGKVRRPGLVRLPAGARVADAVQAAGGVLPGTDVALLNLARRVTDGELIAVGVPAPPAAVPGPGAGGAPPVTGPLNLNTATLAQLDDLPGVGPVLAQRILAYRDAHGGFRSVSELRQVDGIGGARYDDLKSLVTV